MYSDTPIEHTRKAWDVFRESLQLKAFVKKQQAQKTTIQVAVSALFGLLLLAWFEVALYLICRTAVAPHWAALLVLLFNGVVVGGVNAFVLGWKRKLHEAQSHVQRVHFDTVATPNKSYSKRSVDLNGISAPEAFIRSQTKLSEARLELMSAKNQFTDSAHELLERKLKQPYERYVAAPVVKYKKPIAVGASFITGFLLARYLLPKHPKEDTYWITTDLVEVIPTTLPPERGQINP